MEAAIDENYIYALIAISMIDYLTPVRVAVNPTTHALIVEIV